METPFALNVYDYFMNHHNTKPQQIDFNHFNNSMHSHLSTNFNCDSIGAKKNTPKSFIQINRLSSDMFYLFSQSYLFVRENNVTFFFCSI